MELIVSVVLLLVLLVLSVVAWKKASSRAAKSDESLKQATQRAEAQAASLEALTAQLDAAKGTIAELEPYRTILDAKKEVQRILNVAVEDADRIKQQSRDTLNRANQEAERTISSANQNAELLRSEAREATSQAKAQAKEALDKARATAEQRLSEVQKQVTGAHEQAQAIIQKAKQDAEQIAGDAYVALQKADSLQKTLQAMEGAVKGYGDAYIVPTYSLLDDLADEFSHTDAGNNLRRAREHTRQMVLNRTAASCDYVEPARRETAISFVTDAFNGKVDSVLSRVKSDNVGKLEQEIRGAFQLVNHSGAAFRNARVTDAYLDARLDELRWAATAKALQDKEREEQRQLREQIREEERARKEFERAMKEAEKEEAAIQKAMEKVQAQVQKASDEQNAAWSRWTACANWATPACRSNSMSTP